MCEFSCIHFKQMTVKGTASKSFLLLMRSQTKYDMAEILSFVFEGYYGRFK